MMPLNWSTLFRFAAALPMARKISLLLYMASITSLSITLEHFTGSWT